MKVELFSIGPFHVYGYGLMIAIGILCAYYYLDYMCKKHDLDPNIGFWLLIVCLIGGYTGSRILYFITVFDEVLENPKILIDFKNGYVVYGGLIGGLISAFVYLKIKKQNIYKMFDVGFAAVALAQGFGRIGCFLAGCCYGKETDAWFGVVFPVGSMARHGVPLVPTQLFSSAFDFFNFGVCTFIFLKEAKKDKNYGFGFTSYLILYAIGRFVIEFFRNDYRGSVGNLSTSQFICIFFLLLGGTFLTLFTLRAKKESLANLKK
ncbi:MAG: prolipoprotein diacylglyceryl transferase [Lachnospiraceae bacterium]|nr:prolipoprotein diacylglyceryl transferase [Lachnospiraceae bacterium]